MLHQKKKRLHAVEHTEGALNQQMLEESRRYKKKHRRKILAGTAAVLAAATAVFLVIYLQTYTKVRVSDTYTIGNASDNSYQEFADGVLKYSRDGVSYLNRKGQEQWNQPYQIKNPFVDVNQKSAAIADKGGNSIIVLQKEGLKGEIRTTLPIERITVSEQGIVAAILKNETNPQIVCYDTAGNVLVEHKASLAGTGYPMDIALSPDGNVMQVVYLRLRDGDLASKVCCYNFGEAGAEKADHQVMEKEYKGSVIASGFFVNESVSAAVGDNCLSLFKGKEVPKEEEKIEIKGEIQSVFHNDRYIGITVKEEGSSGYRLYLYNTAGKTVLSQEYEGTYKYAKISGSQVILYDGRKCSIFMRTGIHRFAGEMDHNILEIFPAAGVNKYLVINANGMENVRLVK